MNSTNTLASLLLLDSGEWHQWEHWRAEIADYVIEKTIEEFARLPQ